MTVTPTTDWLDLTGRFVTWLQSQYAIDPARVYGTGQSMGCMIHLGLAGKQPDLFTALMFVDGQWDPSQLSGLGESTFIYHVAGGDDRALEGQTATKDMLTQASVDFAVADEEWDATADPSAASPADASAVQQGEAAELLLLRRGHGTGGEPAVDGAHGLLRARLQADGSAELAIGPAQRLIDPHRARR